MDLSKIEGNPEFNRLCQRKNPSASLEEASCGRILGETTDWIRGFAFIGFFDREG